MRCFLLIITTAGCDSRELLSYRRCNECSPCQPDQSDKRYFSLPRV